MEAEIISWIEPEWSPRTRAIRLSSDRIRETFQAWRRPFIASLFATLVLAGAVGVFLHDRAWAYLILLWFVGIWLILLIISLLTFILARIAYSPEITVTSHAVYLGGDDKRHSLKISFDEIVSMELNFADPDAIVLVVTQALRSHCIGVAATVLTGELVVLLGKKVKVIASDSSGNMGAGG